MLAVFSMGAKLDVNVSFGEPRHEPLKFPEERSHAWKVSERGLSHFRAAFIHSFTCRDQRGLNVRRV